MPQWQWLLAQLTRRLWVRATLIGGLGVVAAFLAAVVDRYLPWEIPGSISTEAIDSLLTIIASSMLAVTTFSLSIMVSAYSAATSTVTPRAIKLLIEDRLTQTVLSTFVGTFLFSIVGLVVLKMGAYGERGRVVLFVFTIVAIVLIVSALLRWIDHLTRFGRVGETTGRVEEAARLAIEARIKHPYLGGRPLLNPERDIPNLSTPIMAGAIGYIQNVDMPALSTLCEDYGMTIFVTAIPGTFVSVDTPLAKAAGVISSDTDPDVLYQKIREAFAVSDERSFEQDPRFGLAVMSEIACRALSPAVNDPGTAIDVIGRSTRLMSIWARGPNQGEDLIHPHIYVPPLDSDDLFEDAYMNVARDGASMIEVQLRIQKTLLALSRLGDKPFKAAALHQSQMALLRAQAALNLDLDKDRLHALVKEHRAKP